MTVADIAPLGSWTLSDLAKGQLEACGIALSEIYRVLRRPTRQFPWPGGMKYFGYGLWVIINGDLIEAVGLEGATPETWEEQAVYRAFSGAADVASADAVLQRDAVERFGQDVLDISAQRPPRQRIRKTPPEAPVHVTRVLDSIHPALRSEITRLVDGDFTRVVVHSPTNVTISPPK